MAIMYKAVQRLKQIVSYVASFSPAFFGAGRLKVERDIVNSV